MLQLYDKNHNKIYGLTNYKDLKVERELSGDEVLSFLYPQTDIKYDSIKEECYIRTKKNEYVIKEVNVSDDWTEFVGKVNVEDLRGIPFPHFETVAQNCINTVNLALAGTGWTIGSCNVTKVRTVRKANCSSYDILQQIRKVFFCDFEFDAINKKIYIYQSMGQDRGTYFTEELNLRRLEIQSNSYDYITRLIPIGKDGLKINDINGGKEYVENYQYSNKIISVYWEDNSCETKESLKEDAIAKLNELSKPIKAYSADIYDLASINSQYINVLDYDLGDTITLVSKDKKVKEKQRIVKIIDYQDEPERNSCEIANRTLKFEDIQQDTIQAAETVKKVTTTDGMIDNSKVNFNPIRLEVNTLVAQKADIGDLNAATARIGTLESTKANITDLTVATARIATLEVGSATITQLNAATGRITTLESKTASIESLLAGNITAINIKAGSITAASGIIANGAIGDAQISSVSAVKLTAGTVDTTKVTIAGANSRLKITGNRLQVFATKVDNSLYERISLGDVNGDGTVYGLRVRGADGITILLDETGVKREGITDGSINNVKIGEDANISGTKLDINSVVTTINNSASTTIQSSKVFLNNSTLDVQFSSLNTTVTSQGQTISSHTSSITALNNSISLKVDTQTYNTKMTSLDSNISTINSSLSTQSASISVLQNQITSKVSQTDIDTTVNALKVGGRNLARGTDLITGRYNAPSLVWDKTLNYDYALSNWGFYNGSVTDPTHGYHAHISTIAFSFPVIELKNLNSSIGQTGRWMSATHMFVDGKSFKPGKEYTVSFDMYSDTLTAYVNVGLYHKIIGSGTNNFYSGGLKANYVSNTNKWERVSFKFTVIDTYDDTSTPSMYFYGHYGPEGTKYIKNIKVEEGNKATDWSPAVEDVQGQLDNATTRISSAESSITQLNDSITLKVETSTFNSTVTTINGNVTTAQNSANTANNSIATTNGNVTSLTTRVSSAESSISILQNQITLKVTQSDVDTSINNFRTMVKLNGIELLNLSYMRNATTTDKPFITGTYSIVPASELGGSLNAANYIKVTSAQFLYSPFIACNPSGTQYFKLSVYNLDTNTGTVYVQCCYYDKDKVAVATNEAAINLIPNASNTAANVWNTFDGYIDPLSDTDVRQKSVFMRIRVLLRYGSTGTTYIKDLTWKQLAPQTVATSETRISSAESAINALSDSITLKVSTTDFTSYQSTTNSNISSLTTRVSTAEGSISVLQNQITLKVDSSDVETIKNNVIKVRYIRDWINGSTVNSGNHWVEIKAMRGSTNVAKNKTVTGSSPENATYPYSRITDDNTATTVFATPSSSGGNQYVRIDLGVIYDDIDYIHVWHYYSDSRTYHNSKTEVSSDGINWITLFDSSKSNEYAETSAGHVVNVNIGRIVNRITAAESTITQNSQDITLKVDVDGVISAINQTAETIKIQASKINLTGYATFTSLSTAGQTTINAGNITTGTLDASRISGGTITGSLIKTSNTSDYIYLQNQQISFFKGSSQRILIGFDGLNNSGIELGPRGTATDPYIDFHSSGYNVDHDCRIKSTGGTSADGQGNLHIEASTLDFNGHLILYTHDNSVNSFKCVNPAASRYLEVSTIYGVKGITYWDSDIRYKTNVIHTTKTALDKVLQIEHFDFDYKVGMNHFDVGYISQQLMEINSQWVLPMPQENEYGVKETFYIPNQTTIIPYLSKAIQELKELVDVQTEEIKNLKAIIKYSSATR